MDPFGLTPAQYAAGAAVAAAVFTGLTLIVLAVTARFARTQVNEAQRLRREQFRPFVVVDLHFRSIIAFIKVANIGTTVARNVRVEFDEELVSTQRLGKKALGQVRFLNNTIPTLPPGKEYRVTFDRMPDRLDSDLPKTMRAVVHYEDHDGKRLPSDEYIIDLTLHHADLTPDKGLHEAVEELERLRGEMGKWTDGHRGLLVHAVNRSTKVARDDRSYHLEQVERRVKRGEYRAAAGYVVTWLRHKYGV